jgi:hypothetical protein
MQYMNNRTVVAQAMPLQTLLRRREPRQAAAASSSAPSTQPKLSAQDAVKVQMVGLARAAVVAMHVMRRTTGTWST